MLAHAAVSHCRSASLPGPYIHTAHAPPTCTHLPPRQTKQDGDIQLFSATARRLLTSTWLQGDVIRSVALLGAGPHAGTGAADAPYVLLGCESGNVRVVVLLDGQGQPAAGARPVADLALQPYQGELLFKELRGQEC